MTDAREKIAAILDKERKWPDAEETADAILAAMPDIVRGMVKPLEWDKASLNGNKIGRYAAKSPTGGWAYYIKRVDNGWLYNGTVYLAILDGFEVALDAAMVDANDHHAAQVLKALGLY